MKDGKVLDSWKEIAAYLGRSEKTCRRLEKELGLPVHRLEETPKARVYAYKDEVDIWRKKIQLSEMELPREKSNVMELILPTLIFIAFLIIGSIIWKVFLQKKNIYIASDKPSVAVLYFKNNTGNERFDHWRTMLPMLLIADLTQSKHINVLSEDRLYDILNRLNQLDAESYSPEVLKQVADQSEVDNLLRGAIAKAGDEFRIDVMLQDANSGELIGSESVEGKGEDSIFSMVDELTRKIKADFSLKAQNVSSDIDKEAASITTSSPDAYTYYVEAKRLFQEREYRQSIVLLEKAVAIDPEFAMAYGDMAFAYLYLGYNFEMRKYFEKALALTHRISDRERYVIESTYYLMTERDYPKAIEACQRLLELYPDDSWAHSRLGLMYLDIEEWEKALDQVRITIQIDPASWLGHCRLAEAFMAMGLSHRAHDQLEQYLKNHGDNWSIRYLLALNYINQEKYERARMEVEKALSLNPYSFRALLIKGDVYFFQGEYAEAERHYHQIQESEQFHENVFSRDRLANLYLLKGKFEKAKKALHQGLDLSINSEVYASGFHVQLAYLNLKSGNLRGALEAADKACLTAVEGRNRFAQRSALYVKCLAYLEMGLGDEAQKVAGEIKLIIDKGATWKAVRFYYLFKGLIEQENGHYSKAIQFFEKAIPLLPGQHQISEVMNDHAVFIEPLALAYYKSGELEKSKEKFISITKLTYGRLYYGDIYAEAFYMLGKIYEQQGNTTGAIENYERFLALWKDADPGIAEVEEAKLQLGKLLN